MKKIRRTANGLGTHKEMRREIIKKPLSGVLPRSKIRLIRGLKVIVDRDLAEILGVQTRALRQAVRKNPDRFPADFMLRLARTGSDGQGSNRLPYAFTEPGVAMLCGLLPGERAAKASVEIMRAFAQPGQGNGRNIIRIAGLVRVAEERRRVEEELRDFLDNANDMIQSVNAEGRFLFVNRSWKETLGYSDEDIRGLSVFDIIHPCDKQHCLEEFGRIMSGDAVDRIETVFIAKDGRSIGVEGNVNTRFKNGTHVATRGIFRDITKRKEMEEQLNKLATIDRLTGVWNRYRLEEILKAEVSRSHRYKRSLCLLMFDIDHFKRVNDTFGHQAGDDVLKTIAGLVKGQLRKTDCWGRWGGEEFIIIAPETIAVGAAELAEKIRKLIGGHTFETVGTVTISCGIAECGKTDTTDILLRKADLALYRAKNKGRNRIEF